MSKSISLQLLKRQLAASKLVLGQRLPVTPLQKPVWQSVTWDKMATNYLTSQGALQKFWVCLNNFLWERSYTDRTLTNFCIWCTTVTVCAEESATLCANVVWINIKGTAIIFVISAVLCFFMIMLNYIHGEGLPTATMLLASCSAPHMCTLPWTFSA